MTKKLSKNIGLVTGVAYCITIVIGAGILGLPGVAYKMAGFSAVYAWLFNLLLTIPLLYIFGRMISKVQSAGGLADCVKYAFGDGPLFQTCQIILIATLYVGTAAIAWIGAGYAASSSEWLMTNRSFMAVALVILPVMINCIGLQFGSTVQNIWATVLIGFLLLVVFVSMPNWQIEHVVPTDFSLTSVWGAMGLVWFAYTGMEMISFLSEEFESPRKFQLALVISFLAIGFIYIGWPSQ